MGDHQAHISVNVSEVLLSIERHHFIRDWDNLTIALSEYMSREISWGSTEARVRIPRGDNWEQLKIFECCPNSPSAVWMDHAKPRTAFERRISHSWRWSKIWNGSDWMLEMCVRTRDSQSEATLQLTIKVTNVFTRSRDYIYRHCQVVKERE